MRTYDVVIVGGGPTGLGAARHAQRHGLDWLLLEATDHVGGLATSVLDPQGFTWDLGAHVEFSHYEEFTRMCDAVLGPDGWYERQRDTRIRLFERWIPFPLQNNLHHLPPRWRWECVRDLVAACDSPARASRTYDDWCLGSFGEAFCNLFMRPYAEKIWGYPASELDRRWVHDRVPVPNLATVLRAICLGEDATAWGPNYRFRYPKTGGMGSLWTALARLLPPERIRLNAAVHAIDSRSRTLTHSDGEAVRYDALVTTAPLPSLYELLDAGREAGRCDRIVHAGSHYVGVGVEAELPDSLRTVSWFYFPESPPPFYRVTVFSNYSPANVPDPARHVSFLAEVTESPRRPVAADRLAHTVIDGLRQSDLIHADTRVVSVWQARTDYGYPTPFIDRDAVIDPLLDRLEAIRIFSRGRFGAWKYEVSNQDHAYMQGVEVIEHIVRGVPEITLRQPHVIHGGGQMPFPYSQWRDAGVSTPLNV